MKIISENAKKNFVFPIFSYLCDVENNIKDRLFTFEELITISSLTADELERRHHPARDDISQREAWETYGRSVVNAAEKSGKVTIRMIGNRKLFSRRELNAFRVSRELLAVKS